MKKTSIPAATVTPEERRKLWDELHPGPPPPISHPIPKLTLPPIPPARPSIRAVLEPKRRPGGLRKWRVAGLVLPVLLVQGCTNVSYTSPNGERFSRTSFGATTSIAALTVETSTNGVRRVEMQGYTNDANQALGTVTEAAVRAALSAPK